MFFRFTASMRRVPRFCASGCGATKCWHSSADFRAAWWEWKRVRRRTTGRASWPRLGMRYGHHRPGDARRLVRQRHGDDQRRFLSPARRRACIEQVRAQLHVSERRACAALGQHRSTQRKLPRGRDDERRLTADIIELARQYGRYGYRKIAELLRQAGWIINDKRVERIWRREGLKVPPKQPKRGRLWLADGSCIRLRPEHRNHVWSYDFVEERTHDGRKVSDAQRARRVHPRMLGHPCRPQAQGDRPFRVVRLRCFFDSSKQRPPTLPEIGCEAPATVSAPLVVSLPWRVTARCPIVDPDLAPGRSAIPVRVAAMVLTARRLLRFLVLGRSNSILRLRRARGRDRCLARPRRIVALGAGAGGEKRCVDAARRWSGAATESNGSDCWATTQTMRGLRRLTETQLPSVRESPTQDGLSAVVCAPATMSGRRMTAANGARPVAGVVSAMDASSARLTAAANLAVAITAAPTPATTRHANATRSLRRKRRVGQKKPNSG
jgi:HTH-like domain